MPIYRLLTNLFAPLIALYLRLRKAKGKEDATRFKERLGFAATPRPKGKLVWCHAASVGEAMSVLSLLRALRSRHPEWFILLTTGTVTSAQLVAGRLPEGAQHHYMPVDRWPYVTRFLDHWKPDLALWVESELWPNMLSALKERRIQAVLLNGRLSEKSYRRWRMMGGAKQLLSVFALGLAQTGAERSRFAALGMNDVRVIGNLKFTTEPLPCDEAALTALREETDARPVWLMASPHAGEEEIALAVHKHLHKAFPGLLTIIAPRHPARAAEIASLIAKSGLRFAQRSKGERPNADTGVYLADTMGEMGLFYRLCPVCCLAGSFTWGGHNPVEPAQLSCATLFGPRMDNFAIMADDMLAAGAARQVLDEQELADALLHLMKSPEAIAALAKAGQEWAAAKHAILEQTLDALDDFFAAEDKMKTPSFWYRKKGLRARALSPLGQLYRAAGAIRRAQTTPYKPSVLVICIGNIVAGGAGKTPTALAIAQILIKKGKRVAFVSRGYGGSERGPVRVDINRHTARDVGDEALLLARAAPCWIGRQRAAALREAEKEADIIILDDGLQNPKIAADINLLVIDGGAGLGNGCLIPAGPLRETLADALSRIDGIIMIGQDRFDCTKGIAAPILRATLKPSLPPNLIGTPKVLAFAGIGRPQKFYDSCREAGLKILDTQDFPDHYHFSADDLAALKARSDIQGLQLITTSKDFVRLPESFRANVTVLDVTLEFEDPAALVNLALKTTNTN